MLSYLLKTNTVVCDVPTKVNLMVLKNWGECWNVCSKIGLSRINPEYYLWLWVSKIYCDTIIQTTKCRTNYFNFWSIKSGLPISYLELVDQSQTQNWHDNFQLGCLWIQLTFALVQALCRLLSCGFYWIQSPLIRCTSLPAALWVPCVPSGWDQSTWSCF